MVFVLTEKIGQMFKWKPCVSLQIEEQRKELRVLLKVGTMCNVIAPKVYKRLSSHIKRLHIRYVYTQYLRLVPFQIVKTDIKIFLFASAYLELKLIQVPHKVESINGAADQRKYRLETLVDMHEHIFDGTSYQNQHLSRDVRSEISRIYH